MTRILIGLLFTAMLGAAFAGPPIDFEVVCGEDAEATLVGVLSLVEGQAHLALLPDVVCEESFVVVAVGDSELEVGLTWDVDSQTWSLVVGETTYEGDALKVVTVPQEAIAGMLAAHRQRTAAFERAAANRERALERAREEAGELDRDRDRDCEPDCGGGPPIELGPPVTPGPPVEPGPPLKPGPPVEPELPVEPGPPDGLPPAEDPDPPIEVPGPALQGPGHGRS
jgi:hypothetical protein